MKHILELNEDHQENGIPLESRLDELQDELRQLRSQSRTTWLTRFAALALFVVVIAATALAVRWGVEAQGGGGSSPAPGVINYQGQLTDAGGNPLNGSFDITFALYDVSESGTALWQEAHTGANAIAVSSGLFSTLLGSIQPIQGDVMASSPLYLGISVGSDVEMTPRQPVSSVAYALLANDVADGAITTPKLAAGAVTTDKIAPNAVSKVVYKARWTTFGMWYSISSSTWTPLLPPPTEGPLSGTFTTTGGDLLIIGGPSKIRATACDAGYSVALDGELPDPATDTMCTHNMTEFSACWGFRYISGVPAGTHTIQAIARNGCGTTIIGDWADNPIVVLELKR